MKYDEKVYGNLKLLVNICVSEKMRTTALISIENLLLFKNLFGHEGVFDNQNSFPTHAIVP